MKSKVSALLMMIVLTGHAQAAPVAPPDAVVKPLMARYQIPGMAVAVSVNGETHFWHYGVASKATRKPVDENTLFEIGSLSKTFTATLASKAQQDGKLDFSAPASQYLPALKGSAFDNVTLLNLATHTSGTPLFVPDAVKNTTQLMDWYRAWQPEKPVGTERVYSNLGIGLLGMITAKALDKPFSEAMEQGLLRDFGMTHTFINVPVAAMDDYAQGYNKDDKPVRVTPGPLDAESYGLKSGSADLLRYLQIQLGEQEVAPGWRQAINATHSGYYRSGEFTQGLMWEYYPWPSPLSRLVEGNSSQRIMKGLAATAIVPPQPAPQAAWYNKTGSTNGFSTYAVFIPEKRIALIMLANKWFPNDDRIKAAYAIIQELDK
ncbi:CSA family class C beta-lactamase [Cronobacter sakazakii]|uniref:CSA family class C beta-lactamase n=1 Tax=Cronobacter sakazakii TaxID=28141 RepID=UPI000B4B1167|nr:CSA family class C beta-lactamase [Cronobacter sakazakii]EKA9348446.1 CSA family class C beta-lactamase [Cronobacter sakazakii]EKA9350018.1 CSA family class C beta-lactamase [Cronobacter sakazakii]EKK4041534.1 CSA family class C beta-lactamase [Cronobacter sakazakii]EKK4045365.1 CSA family class C beta-lactamase [Cronobacter sakazakii]ELL7786392.1 CSA family class C beta-lactamase [Cronobacter sakazakii]